MKVAMTDMDIAWEDKEKNKSLCAAMVKEAAMYGADLILFPEMTLTGFSNDVPKIADKEQETLHFFTELAEEKRIAIGFGYVSMPDKKGRNHFALIDANGSLRMDYLKLHPFTHGGEADFYEGGNEFGCFTMLEQWNCAGFVCYDLRFPEIFEIASRKTEIIVVPANWPQARKEHWTTLLRARAIENQVYMLGVNCVGEKEGQYFSGDSCVVDPNGNVMESLSDQEGLIVLDIPNNTFQIREGFPIKQDRRPELYERLSREIMGNYG